MLRLTTLLAITFNFRWALRQLSLLCVAWVGFASSASTEDVFRLMLEEPINGEIHGGVGNLRGWAVASEGIDKVEIFIDGQYAFDAPYDGARGDVGGAFPEVPNAAQSGFSSAYAYSLLSSGTHTIAASAHDCWHDKRECSDLRGREIQAGLYQRPFRAR